VLGSRRMSRNEGGISVVDDVARTWIEACCL
jgi:hypothetical protein